MTEKQLLNYVRICLACLASSKNYCQTEGKDFSNRYYKDFKGNIDGVIGYYCFIHKTKNWVTFEQVVKKALAMKYCNETVYLSFNNGELDNVYKEIFFNAMR